MNRHSAATAAQARGLDGAANDLGVSPEELMAVAGFQCARLALRLLANPHDPRTVAVLAGRGNNGGDALGCARHLARWGCEVRALTWASDTDPRSSSARQVHAAQESGVEIRVPGGAAEGDLAWATRGAALLVDGLLGTGSRGAPREEIAIAIAAANLSGARILAVDLPSGLDADTGGAAGECVRARFTLMLAAPKLGCLAARARQFVGELWLADIGAPAGAYLAVELDPPTFVGDGGLGRVQAA